MLSNEIGVWQLETLHSKAGRSTVRQSRALQRSRHSMAGQSRELQGGRQGRAGQARAGQGRAGQSRAGQTRAQQVRQGQTSKGRANYDSPDVMSLWICESVPAARP